MRSPRLLWAAPYCLHDTSSGAAIHLKTMLEKFVERGITVQVLSALTFDAPTGTALFPNFNEQLKSEHSFFDLTDTGITYQYQKTASLNVMAMTNEEERAFYSRFLETLTAFRPDAIMQFGGSLLDLGIRNEAKRRGIPILFAVMNGNYVGYDFPETDLVFTMTPSAAQAYAKANRVNVLSTGPFIRPERVLVPADADPALRTSITFVNPHPTKGVSLIARLALMAQKALPEARFLVVQSRGNWFESIKALGLTIENFPNVDVVEHVTDMRLVYARTKVLLAPSLWYEVFGLVAAEALLNGIPVIASSSGGLCDAVGEGGVILDTPAQCRENFLYLPSEEDMAPWLEALTNMIGDSTKDEQYATWSAKARKAAEVHDIEKVTDHTIDLFTPLFARQAGDRPHVL